MCGRTESPRVKRINELCDQHPRERWLHVPTNKYSLMIMEIGGACWLEDTERRTIEVSRATLETSEAWRKLP